MNFIIGFFSGIIAISLGYIMNFSMEYLMRKQANKQKFIDGQQNIEMQKLLNAQLITQEQRERFAYEHQENMEKLKYGED